MHPTTTATTTTTTIFTYVKVYWKRELAKTRFIPGFSLTLLFREKHSVLFLRVKFCVHGKALFFSSLLTNFANTWMLKIHIPVYVEMLVWRSLKHTQASVTTWLLLLLCMIIAEASLSLALFRGMSLSNRMRWLVWRQEIGARTPPRNSILQRGNLPKKICVTNITLASPPLCVELSHPLDSFATAYNVLHILHIVMLACFNSQNVHTKNYTYKAINIVYFMYIQCSRIFV